VETLMASRRGQWPVVAVHAVVAATVLVLVAVLALVVKPPAPPGIAAFAPQAAKPITKAPQNQSAHSGAGAGQCAPGQVCTGPSASPSAASLTASSPTPRATGGAAPPGLQCYEWPDGSITQTFDPQSPPCISTWNDTKGNGGATSPGVSATEIRVALPVNNTASPTGTWPDLKPMVDFFNTRFQFYGRQIKIVPFTSQQANEQYVGTFNVPTSQRADAAQITRLKVFATTDFVDPLQYSWSLPVFRDVLSKNKIISLAGGETTPYGTAQDLAGRAPYEWTYYPTIDALMNNVATMTCRQLVGKKAEHAPDASLRSKTRKFAVVIPGDQKLGGPLPGLSGLLRTLEGCGVRSPQVVRYDYTRDSRVALAASYRQMANDGVTSVIHFPYYGDGTSSAMGIAAQVNYRPEWVMIGWQKYLTDYQLNSPPTETEGAFGVGIWNKMPPLESEMWYQAYLAAGGDPGPLNNGDLPSGRAFYQEMLLLASGVQMAGPKLTPESFAEALRSTRFANPGAGSAPFYQGTVGFGPGDSAMVSDYTGFWLDTETTGNQVQTDKNLNNHRANCYVALGRRWTVDTWPTSDGFYRGCR
jgi:hypothetical protein